MPSIKELTDKHSGEVSPHPCLCSWGHSPAHQSGTAPPPSCLPCAVKKHSVTALSELRPSHSREDFVNHSGLNSQSPVTYTCSCNQDVVWFYMCSMPIEVHAFVVSQRLHMASTHFCVRLYQLPPTCRYTADL